MLLFRKGMASAMPNQSGAEGPHLTAVGRSGTEGEATEE
jgi:hypothetical protein